MRRRNDANIDAAHLAAADADDRPILQHAEQLDLHVEAHVADFVEEERAALARLEMADPARGGPGERAFFLAEKFGFDEVGGDGAAIDRRQDLAGADDFVVDGAGAEFLARARRGPDEPKSRLQSLSRLHSA